MKILKLHIKNFGPHSDLEIDSKNSKMIGLFGLNGSGKSHIFEAIRVVFGCPTKKLADLVKFGAKKAEIELSVLLKNKTLNFTKTIQPSGASKQTFSIEGEATVYTKNDDIIPIIENFLGTDVKTFMSACFVSQGELDRLFYGTDAQREEVLIKLLNLSYILTKHRHINKVKGELNKVTEQYTKTVAQLNFLTTEKETLEHDLNNTLALSKQDLKDLSKVKEEAEQAKKHWESYKHGLDATTRLKTLLRQQGEVLKGFNSLEKLSEKISTLEKFLQANSSNKARCEIFRTSKQAYEATLLKVKKLKESLTRNFGEESTWAKTQKELTTFISQFNTDELDASLETVRTQLQVAVVNKERREELDAAATQLTFSLTNTQAQLKEAQQQLETAETEIKEFTVNAVKRLPNKLDAKADSVTIRQTLTSLVRFLSPLQNTLKSTKHLGSKCPVCNSELTADQTLLEEIAIVLELYESLAPLEQKIVDLKSVISTLTSTVQTLQHKQADLKKEIAKVPEVENYEELASDLEALEGSKIICVNNYKKKLLESQNLTKDLTAIKDMECRLEELGKDCKNLEKLEQDLLSAQDEQMYLSQVNDLTGKRDQYTFIAHKLSEITKQYPNTDWDKVYTQEELDTLTLKFGDTGNALEELTNKEREYKSRQRFLTDSIAQKDKEINHIRESLKMLQADITFCEHLDILLSLTARDSGVTRSYLRHVFEGLTPFVGEFLEQMNPDFGIVLDAEKPMHYLCYRKSSDQHLFSMQNLSGGQKVVLSLAFLLAMQKYIIPEVGFLVLDEPSLHLDEPTVSALGDLLQNLPNFLNTQENQLWVCDHNLELIRSIDDVVALTTIVSDD